MGGANEFATPAPAAAVQTPPPAAPPTPPPPPANPGLYFGDNPLPVQQPIQVQQGLNQLPNATQMVRCHLSNGEVHFHVDAEGVKVAVPVAEWYNAWGQLRNLRIKEWSYVDAINNAHLEVKVGYDAAQKVEIVYFVHKLAGGLGQTYQQMDTFIAQCRK